MNRTWEPKEHPQWLAFEVEGRLKIRPAQHRVAQYLMDNPGAILQLNMGEAGWSERLARLLIGGIEGELETWCEPP